MVSPDGVVPSRIVGVSASVNRPLHHKVQKFCSGTGSPRWSGKRAVKRLCVCVTYKRVSTFNFLKQPDMYALYLVDPVVHHHYYFIGTEFTVSGKKEPVRTLTCVLQPWHLQENPSGDSSRQVKHIWC